jgi:3,4-dihydroxy 2-butanone 4-phosphate synthase/GTP cyclohydrolase II
MSQENDTELHARVTAAIADIRAGKMVIVVDDEDRENEGDLTMAAQFITKEAVNFMATWGRGLICLTLTEEAVERLGLPLMAVPGHGQPQLGTAFTVSIEARHGVTSGISAADRAHTIRVAIDPNSRPADLVTPGHVFPLRARRGGVLVRTGHTEGSVDLARLAGLDPSGVICEIMNDDGSMARMPDLEKFSKKHDLRIVSIADLIQYRALSERLVRRVQEGTIQWEENGSTWRAVLYETMTGGVGMETRDNDGRSDGRERQFVALVKGEIDGSKPTLCRVHTGALMPDLFTSLRTDAATPDPRSGARLRQALAQIEREGSGICVYLPPRGSLADDFARLVGRSEETPAPRTGEDGPLREFGLGAQVLADLGVKRLHLLTNNPRKIKGLGGFGLVVEGAVPLEPLPTKS